MSSPVRSVAVSLCAAVWLTGMLVGCSVKEGGDKSPTQVAVKVNKEEISVHQINDLLSRAGNIPEDQVSRARSAIVERLIEQELLLQQAKNGKLDRDPRVMQILEYSRRDILARAYSEQVASNVPKPTEAQISKFYDDNPALFSKRRIYSMQEIGLQLAPERFDQVREHLESMNDLQQLLPWLREQKIPFALSASAKAAEQFPPELAKQLSQLNQGGVTLVRTPAGAVLIIIAGVQDEPIDRAKAKPAIELFLMRQAQAEALKNELQRLREAATINYMGEFTPPAVEPSAPAAAEQGPVVSPDASSEDDSVRSLIEKGGIKLK